MYVLCCCHHAGPLFKDLCPVFMSPHYGSRAANCAEAACLPACLPGGVHSLQSAHRPDLNPTHVTLLQLRHC